MLIVATQFETMNDGQAERPCFSRNRVMKKIMEDAKNYGALKVKNIQLVVNEVLWLVA